MSSAARSACGPTGVPCAMWPVSWAGLLGVPVGGGPPARRPRREPSARRVVSKPGQAPPPPTGTAAWPRLEARPCPPDPPAPSTPAALGVLVCPARPRHRPRVPQPGPPDPPAPSTSVGPGRCSAALRVGSLSGKVPPPPTGTAARPCRVLAQDTQHESQPLVALQSHVAKPAVDSPLIWRSR